MQIKFIIHLQSISFQIPNWEMLIRNYGVFVILGVLRTWCSVLIASLSTSYQDFVAENKMGKWSFAWFPKKETKARMGRELTFLLFSLLFTSRSTQER